MMNLKLVILIFSLSIWQTLPAQLNLIPNGDFEEFIQCHPIEVDSSGYGVYLSADISTILFDWRAKGSHPYYGNLAFCPFGYDAFLIALGYKMGAYNGNGFTRLTNIYSPDSSGLASRDYLHIQLEDSLSVGELYYMEFYTRAQHAGRSKFTGELTVDNSLAVTHLGVQFNEEFAPEPYGCHSNLMCYPVLSSPHWRIDSVVGALSQWHRAHFCFVADEPYIALTIGNFTTGDSMIMLQNATGKKFRNFDIDAVVLIQIEDSLALNVEFDTICIGESVLMTTGYGHMAASFQWDLPGADTPEAHGDTVLITYSNPGIYKIDVTAHYCSYEYSLHQSDSIVVIAPPKVDPIAPDKIEVERGSLVTLVPCVTNENIPIRWIPSEGLSCDDCYYPTVVANNFQTYRMIFDENSYCPFECNLEVHVYVPEINLYVPTAFSPNGDGINDLFEVYGVDLIIERLEIYDRWGGLLFRDEASPIQWSGQNAKGQDAPPGIYVYEIRYLDSNGLSHTQSGEVQLIR